MEFDFSRLRRADRLVAVAALALALFMFAFDWYGESIGGTLPGTDLSGAGGSLTGWQAFTNSRWMWLATVLVALASVLIRARSVRLPSSVQPGSVVALLGAASVVLIAYRIVHHPSASSGFAGFHASFGIRVGIWLGLIAAAAVAGGGYVQLRAESVAGEAQRESTEDAFSGLTVAVSPAVSPASGESGAPPAAPSHPPSGRAPSDAPGDASGDAP